MRCPRCQFENLPGEDKCFKCGSILKIKKGAINIYPPRMAKWKKPFRSMLRGFRNQKIIPENVRQFQIPKGLDKILSTGLLGLLLSIIPGLAHLITRRFKEIYLLFITWLVLLLCSLFFFGSIWGFILLGPVICVHAWIGLKYGLYKELSNLRERIITLLIVMALLCFVYWAVPRVPFFGLRGIYTSLTIPSYNIEAGDYLLARIISTREGQITRGSVVLFHPLRLNLSNRRILSRRQELIVGEIIGLPGELVNTKNNIFLVNNQELDPEKFPVPNWLQDRKFSVSIGDNSYFVSSEYNLAIHGYTSLTNQNICVICVVNASDIEARAFMRWWPLSKRGFIR